MPGTCPWIIDSTWTPRDAVRLMANLVFLAIEKEAEGLLDDVLGGAAK